MATSLTAGGGGQTLVTLRDEGRRERRFVAYAPSGAVKLSTSRADLDVGESRVRLLPDGRYHVSAKARGADGTGEVAIVDLIVTPQARAYFPGASLGGGIVSGYAVPALRAEASGSICTGGTCEQFTAAQAYHDHNWGVWRGVTWDWGASRAGQYAFLYGRVYPADTSASIPPVLVYLVDSLGFRAVFRPRLISYEDERSIRLGANVLRVPSGATFFDARGEDTLRVDISIEDAIATDTRPRRTGSDGDRGDPLGTAKAHPYFIQMKGTVRISGRLDGTPLVGIGTGFFETYR